MSDDPIESGGGVGHGGMLTPIAAAARLPWNRTWSRAGLERAVIFRRVVKLLCLDSLKLEFYAVRRCNIAGDTLPHERERERRERERERERESAPALCHCTIALNLGPLPVLGGYWGQAWAVVPWRRPTHLSLRPCTFGGKVAARHGAGCRALLQPRAGHWPGRELTEFTEFMEFEEYILELTYAKFGGYLLQTNPCWSLAQPGIHRIR